MSLVAIVLTAPAAVAQSHSRRIGDDIIAAVGATLNNAGGKTGARRWLNPGIAMEIPVDGDRDRCSAALKDRFIDAPFDVVVLPAADRRKALLVADMDSTIITGETMDEVAELAGVGPAVAEITKRAMNGEIGFGDALGERLGLLRGQPATLIERTWERMSLTPGARTLVATMRANGAFCVLVSGGFSVFTERVAKAVGFDSHQSNTLEVVDGRLTGGTLGPVIGPDGKLGALHHHALVHDLPLSATLATGDGANDIPMLQAAGLGVAFHPRPLVAATIDVAIRHGDLTALLYLQDYAANEFAE